ncbi:HpcH/HpaI aldolase family protein [Albidovulum sp.]|uniref:HpcH/HpaI aldolase family protein n=1 Tax=Albidovulum sp. TaxID=1872424 RepID=UPI001DA18E34|nr:HpcH/HpaI aldolase/citrate lyase family protein [Paracoccaceae bacterium]
MQIPRNRFKAALVARRHQLGIWNILGGSSVPELLATAGYDWIVVDTEHSPTDVPEVLPALQAIAAYPDVSAVVRPAANDPVLVKRLLDMGAQTLLIPYVQTRAEAEAAVAAVRYPPRGIRGVAGHHRASRYGAIADYMAAAEAEICLILQIETRLALDNLEEIAAVEGVDGLFIGPGDLAASLGHPGRNGDPEVIATIDATLARIRAAGLPAGILTLRDEDARRVRGAGSDFTAVGTDVGLLAEAARRLAERSRNA